MRALGRRGPPRWRRQRGLTLVELLLATALLVLIGGFMAVAFSTSRRAVAADRRAEQALRTDAALRTLGAALETTVPFKAAGSDGKTRIAFAGRADGLDAIVAGDGEVLRGGFLSLTLRLRDGRLEASLTPAREGRDTKATAQTRTVVLCSGVSWMTIRYFGAPNGAAAPAWRADWVDAQALPRLVSLRVGLGKVSRAGPRDLAQSSKEAQQDCGGEPTQSCSGDGSWSAERTIALKIQAF